MNLGGRKQEHAQNKRYVLYIVSQDKKTKLYWNRTLDTWVKRKVNASLHSTEIGDEPASRFPSQFGIRVEILK